MIDTIKKLFMNSSVSVTNEHTDKIETDSEEVTLIKMIHAEFDTAEDRLLKQANEILATAKESITDISEVEKKADRLKKLGFIKTPTVEKASIVEKERNDIEKTISFTEEQAKTIQEYKVKYPYLKFLTESELDIICKKYGLIYAPIENFIKDVPDKNITEIENATPLRAEDTAKNEKYIIIKKFWYDCPQEVRNFLKGKIPYKGYGDNNTSPDEQTMELIARNNGYSGDYKGYIFKSATIHEVIRDNKLFICAPPSHFDLSNLSQESELGFFKVETREIKDPIVFRYCRGGIQVLSKWGLEGEDQMLLNETLN